MSYEYEIVDEKVEYEEASSIPAGSAETAKGKSHGISTKFDGDWSFGPEYHHKHEHKEEKRQEHRQEEKKCHQKEECGDYRRKCDYTLCPGPFKWTSPSYCLPDQKVKYCPPVEQYKGSVVAAPKPIHVKFSCWIRPKPFTVKYEGHTCPKECELHVPIQVPSREWCVQPPKVKVEAQYRPDRCLH